ncbi:MAG TPA: DUF541 domain-containing protein [Dehalococcoidia bacterium]|nr:DUF541 domain-containing protein [Dehalococcoidia bacterium]
MKTRYLFLSCVILVVVMVGASSCVIGEGAEVSPPSISAHMTMPELGEPFRIIYSQQQVGLWVTGEGIAMAVPDIVLLRLGIESEAKTVSEAQHNAAEAMNRVMKTLKASGVAERDVQTQQFSICPVRRWIESERTEEIIGFRVANIVVAKIRQVEKAGSTIDAVAAAGGDLTRIESISFSVDDPAPYYNEAREGAVKAAMAKAKQVASIANIKLGRVLYISEGISPPPIVRDYMTKAEGTVSPPTPITPGELEFRVKVQMVYDID